MSHRGITMADPSEPVLRKPTPEDAVSVNRLIASCPPLDGNSVYCNLLQCTHFDGTSIAAEIEGELAGFISAYLLPARSNTLFVWQVAVAAFARGRGLAKHMLHQLLQRDFCREVNYLETTITPGNTGSRVLFTSFARFLETGCEESLLFDRDRHFGGDHDSELLLRIGPFQTELIGIGAGVEKPSELSFDNRENSA